MLQFKKEMFDPSWKSASTLFPLTLGLLLIHLSSKSISASQTKEITDLSNKLSGYLCSNTIYANYASSCEGT